VVTIYPERWPGRLGRLLLDLLALLWTAAWALAGWVVYRLVTGLEVVADSITHTGDTFNGWVRAFRSASPGGIPGLSGALHGLADALQRSGGDPLVRNGIEAHARIEQLAVALGLFVALLPIVCVTGMYLLWRVRDARELSAAAEFVRGAERTGRIEEANAVLAHRAVALLPFRQLMRASADPIGDLAAGRHEALARAMLRRAGQNPLPPARTEGQVGPAARTAQERR
jgi:uncharacterized membrane protein